MRKDIWVFLFMLGVSLFSWPFMNIFKADLITYLFVVWVLFIASMFVSTYSGKGEGKQ